MGEPSICNDLRKENQFKLPSFYAEHGIVSTIDVLIKACSGPVAFWRSTSNRNWEANDTASPCASSSRTDSRKRECRLKRRHDLDRRFPHSRDGKLKLGPLTNDSN